MLDVFISVLPNIFLGITNNSLDFLGFIIASAHYSIIFTALYQDALTRPLPPMDDPDQKYILSRPSDPLHALYYLLASKRNPQVPHLYLLLLLYFHPPGPYFFKL